MKHDRTNTYNPTGYEILPTSYAVQTADTLLRLYGIEFKKSEVAQQVKTRGSFYKNLLQTPLHTIQNRVQLQDYHQLIEYGHKQLTNILLACHQMSKDPTIDFVVGGEKQTQLNKIQAQLKEEYPKIEKAKQELTSLDEQVASQAKEQLKKWQQLLEQHADKIIAGLEKRNFIGTGDFRQRLIQRLDQMGTSIEVPQDILKELKIKKPPKGIAKAILVTMLEDANYGTH